MVSSTTPGGPNLLKEASLVLKENNVNIHFALTLASLFEKEQD